LGDEQKRKEYDRTFQAYPRTNPYSEHPYRQSQPHAEQYYNPYQNFAYDTRPPFFTLFKENIFTIILWCGYAIIFYELVILLEQKMT
jgi:hypothetical protein